MKSPFPVLVLLGALTSLTIDINLPALPEIAVAFDTNPEKVQWILSAFMLSFALGQLIFGPISDGLGRKPPLLLGIAIYGLANILAFFATDLNMLIAAWFLLGLGACAGTVGWVSIVRDLFQNNEMVKATARISAYVGLGSVIAPLAGALLTRRFGWTAAYPILLGVTAFLLIPLIRQLPETNRHRGDLRGKLKPGTYLSIVKNPKFLLNTAINALGFAALFAFIVSASPLLIGHHGLSARAFGLWFGSNALVYVAGGFLAIKLAGGQSRQSILLLGSWMIIAGGCLISLYPVAGNPAYLMPMIYLVTLGSALLMPMGTAGALEPFGEKAGAAAALQGAIRFGTASFVGMILGFFPNQAHIPLARVMIVSGLICLAAAWLTLTLNRSHGTAPLHIEANTKAIG